MSLPMDFASRLTRLILTLMLIVSWAGIARPVDAADTPGSAVGTKPSDAPEPTAEQFKAYADQLDLVTPLIQEAHRRMPYDRFDAEAIVELVGRNPGPLFEWVRDQTTWVGYQGCLRGPAGVLQDRIGNSLDRSLLLAELLRAAGQDVRLAHAELPAELAKNVLGKVRPLPRTPNDDPEAARKAAITAIDAMAAKHHLDGAMFRQAMDRGALAAAREREETTKNSAEQIKTILPRLGAVPATNDIEQDRLIRAISSHYWVQRKEQGNWIDLDPLLPDAAMGQPVAQATSTTEWPQHAAAVPLDAKLYHEVELRLIVEQWKDGKLVEKPVLIHAVRPAMLNGATVQFRHAPLHTPQIFGEGTVEELRAQILKETEWLPILAVNQMVVVQGSLDVYGDVNDKPTLNAVAAFGGKAVGKTVSGFNDALGGVDPVVSTGVLTAEWIDYVIRVPGEPPRIIRRELFDLVGSAARASARANTPIPSPKPGDVARFNRGLALLGETEILIAGFVPSADFVEYLGGKTLIANSKPTAAICRQAADLAKKRLDAALTAKLTSFPADLYGFAVKRQAWSAHRDDVYLDSPNIVSRHAAMRQNHRNEIVHCAGMDVVANGVAVRPGLGEKAFGMRVAQGIVDTNAELAMLAGCCTSHNTADAFARRGDDEWMVVRKSTDAAWTGLMVPPDDRARIDAELGAGQVVLVPTKPITIDGMSRLAYWRIDPASGECLGIGDHGWGVALTENQIVNAKVFVRSVQTGGCLTFAYVNGSKAGAALCVLGGGAGIAGDAGKMYGFTAGTAGILSILGIVVSTVGMYRSNIK